MDKVAELKLSIKFPVLGKRLPDKMKEIISSSKQGNWEIKEVTAESGTIAKKLIIAGEELFEEEYELQLIAKTQGTVASKTLKDNSGLVILDLKITKELEMEGIARDLIRSVQQARKDANYDVADRIILFIKSSSEIIAEILSSYKSLIEDQTLSRIVDSYEDITNSGDEQTELYKVDSNIQEMQLSIITCKVR